ncbi:hypothetical protein BGX26_001548 [Mortierella sp. AD094]|nr:hypothetical protein BGX26_001548 [Mortierella sp. AD094]
MSGFETLKPKKEWDMPWLDNLPCSLLTSLYAIPIFPELHHTPRLQSAMARNNLCCTGSIPESTTWCHSSPARAFPHFLFIFLLIGLFVTFAAAQVPNPVAWMAYTTVDEETLYIQGGGKDSSITSVNQFFALDLTHLSWNTSNPPWKALSLGSGTQAAPTDSEHSMTVSKDKQSLIIWGRLTGISVYNITGGFWFAPSSMPLNSNILDGLQVVTDPGSGLIYIPSGAGKGLSMMQYDPSTGNNQVLPMPAQIANYSFKHYSAVWSTQRSTILLYGGYPKYNRTIPRRLLFGGATFNLQPLGGIYILDVQSMSWTKGTDIGPSLNRMNMACTNAGDNFVAWGGGQGNDNISSLGTPVIYNLKTNQWTTQFSLPVPTSAIPINTPNTPHQSTSGAAIGGAIPGVVVLLAIVFFVYTRYKSIRKRRDKSQTSSTIAIENINDPNNMQSVKAVLPDIRPSHDQLSTSKRIHSPNYIGQSPQAVLNKDINMGIGHEIAMAAPKVNNVNNADFLPSEIHVLSRSPQDHGQMTQRSPSELRNLELRQAQNTSSISYEDNAGLEAQIAQLKAQQERAEQLRLEQQAQLEMLRQQMMANK